MKINAHFFYFLMLVVVSNARRFRNNKYTKQSDGSPDGNRQSSPIDTKDVNYCVAILRRGLIPHPNVYRLPYPANWNTTVTSTDAIAAGIDRMKGKIVGGVEVPISMYPHVVGLGISGMIFCGGSIIADRAVLTAAHCLQNDKNTYLSRSEMAVYAGTDIPGQGKIYKICRVLPHPKYRMFSLNYDIGLVFTTKPFRYGPRIQKIRLAPNQSWKHSKAKFIVPGFGVTSTNGVTSAKRLHATPLFFVDSDTCDNTQTKLKLNLMVPKHGFCLIGQKWSGDCSGDSGSGVIWKRHIVGVVSAGRDLYCGSDMTPSMYTDAVHFKQWIEAEIKNLNPKTCRKEKSNKSYLQIGSFKDKSF